MDRVVIQPAKLADLPRIMEIYGAARAFMRSVGNPNQWKDNLPCENTLRCDIKTHNLFVMKANDEIHAVFAFIVGDDPTYDLIEDGEWLSSVPYGTLHRVASDGDIHGVFEKAVNYASKRIRHLRVDTHRDNRIMQHLAEKNGFCRCGIIYVADGSPRIAYERL